MRLKIVQVGEAVLRQQAKELTAADIRSREMQELIEWMRETMHDAPGVGLAAPQIAIPLQLAVIEDRPENMKDAPAEFLQDRERKPVAFHTIINPKITLLGPPDLEFFEGCLSLPGLTAVVPRARKVKVECLDHKGEPKTIEASGWYARILQHEIDHLHGTVYIDRMHTRSLMSLDNFNRYWKSTPMAEVAKRINYSKPA
jgi:peptide deformylase